MIYGSNEKKSRDMQFRQIAAEGETASTVYPFVCDCSLGLSSLPSGPRNDLGNEMGLQIANRYLFIFTL